MKIRIAIAEDNRFLAETLKEKISFFDDFEFKFCGANGIDLMEQIEQNTAVDVVLMDIQMPLMDGIAATELIKSKYPQIKIIMLTIYDSDEYVFNAIRAGADGYLLKETNAQELHDGIINVLNEGVAMTPSIALRTLSFIRNNIQIEQKETSTEELALTKRETEILVQLSKGLNYKAIAENLFISTGTVRKHVENIYKKLQVHNKVEAVRKGIRHNLI